MPATSPTKSTWTPATSRVPELTRGERRGIPEVEEQGASAEAKVEIDAVVALRRVNEPGLDELGHRDVAIYEFPSAVVDVFPVIALSTLDREELLQLSKDVEKALTICASVTRCFREMEHLATGQGEQTVGGFYAQPAVIDLRQNWPAPIGWSGFILSA